MISLKQAVSWVAFDSVEGPIPEQVEGMGSQEIYQKEEAAWQELLSALVEGDLVAKGRYSNRQRPQWQVVNPEEAWQGHSPSPKPIAPDAWAAGNLDWRYGQLTLVDGQFIEIEVSKVFMQLIWPLDGNAPVVQGTHGIRRAVTPYLELINAAVDEFWKDGEIIENKKEPIVEWLQKNTDFVKLSQNEAKLMGTFLRHPDKKRGGNTPSSSSSYKGLPT
ncbi:MAG: hypothetical protein HQL53_13140 [Magnetococcales bacterium]|nr:hypothetical protein [Magnetococcales bacterium]